MLKPNAYLSKVQDISLQFLKENKIKALILDVDNTLIDYDRKLSKDIIMWATKLQENGIKIYILSNSNKNGKIQNVANKINAPYKNFAKKPSKSGFIKIQNELKLKSKQIAVVGDQIFTDVIGGNRCKMFTILVDPIDKRDFWYTAWKRPLEKQIKKRFKLINDSK